MFGMGNLFDKKNIYPFFILRCLANKCRTWDLG